MQVDGSLALELPVASGKPSQNVLREVCLLLVQCNLFGKKT